MGQSKRSFQGQPKTAEGGVSPREPQETPTRVRQSGRRAHNLALAPRAFLFGDAAPKKITDVHERGAAAATRPWD